MTDSALIFLRGKHGLVVSGRDDFWHHVNGIRVFAHCRPSLAKLAVIENVQRAFRRFFPLPTQRQSSSDGFRGKGISILPVVLLTAAFALTVAAVFHVRLLPKLIGRLRLLATQAFLFGYTDVGHGVNLRQGLRCGKTRSGGSNLSGGSFFIIPQIIDFGWKKATLVASSSKRVFSARFVKHGFSLGFRVRATIVQTKGVGGGQRATLTTALAMT